MWVYSLVMNATAKQNNFLNSQKRLKSLSTNIPVILPSCPISYSFSPSSKEINHLTCEFKAFSS